MVSRVWRIFGLIGKVEAGVLIYDEGKVIYITDEGIQFDVPLGLLENIKWPFLRMGFGFDTVVYGKKYKFSFSKPNPSAPDIIIEPGDPYPEIVFEPGFYYDLSSLRDIKKDKATTKEWKQILSGY